MRPRFIPFQRISEHPDTLIVDGYHTQGFTLSHWRGTTIPTELQDDTSTGIVLNAIHQQIPQLDYPYVSNNHFDVDGFLGVWAIQNPELALEYESVLRQAAAIGDFREWNPKHPDANHALKLVCWINQVEKEKFYAPFEEVKEIEACVPKYEYFLLHFEDVLKDIEAFIASWEAEYELVHQHLQVLQNIPSRFIFLQDIRLLIVDTPDPLHYYALFANSRDFDIVLSLYSENRYELEYKYTTWVEIAPRYSFPRVHMAQLCEQLNLLETSGYTWQHESIRDTGPILRLDIEKLSRAQRYASPHQREIASSSIPRDRLLSVVVEYYRRHLGQIFPRQKWTWKEVLEFNQALFPELK